MVDIVTRAGKGSPLTNNEVDANFTNLAEVSGVTGEPMGHEDRTTSTISFNASTRTFTIAPVSGSFTVWCKGKKVVVSSAQTVTIPNTSGMHSIYYNANGTLLSKIGYFTFSTEAPTAYVYWNATTGAAPYFGDERHGVVLDWQTHEYLHRTRGAAIANGFLASGYTLNNSATDAATQIAIESGTFFDEDMKIDIVSTATPTAGTYQQNLLFPAKIPVLHLQGTSWVMDAPTNFPFRQGTSRPQYNSFSGGVWSTADVGNNQHATTWILATNNLTYPVIAIIGQSATDNLGEAEAFSFADLTLTGFPSVEFRPLYKLIYKASDGYANSVNAQLVSIVDLRSISAVGSAANPATDHGNLSGLSDDDHPQYLSVDTVRGTLTAAVKASFLPSQAGNAGKFLTTDATSTSWAALTSGNITTALGFTPYNATNPAGYISGITSSNVTTALGFTPYNATNPSGFVTAAGARGAISVTGAGSYDSATGVINIVGGVTSFNTRTGAITLSSADVTTALGFTPYNSTNPNGYLTGITSTQVTTALGYTPYNSSNPSGYISGITSGMVTTALGYTPYNNSNPSGYITSSALSGYLTSASAASTYLPLSGGTITGQLNVNNSGSATAVMRLWSAGSTIWNVGVGDSSGTNFNISADFGSLLINKSSGNVTTPGQFYAGTSNLVLHAGNYSSYSPTLTGGNASGTWGINVTGYSRQLNGYANQTEYTVLDGPANGPVIKVRYDSGTANRYIDIGYKDGNGVYSEGLKIYTGSTLTWGGSTIIHAGNYSSYALPLSGGTVTGATYFNNIADVAGDFYIRGRIYSLNAASNGWNVVFERNGGSPYITNVTYAGNTILHAGNYGSYALPLSGGIATNVTLGVRVNNSVFGGNTSGMSAHSFPAEIRASGAKPTLTWHYESVATRHIALDADGALNLYNPGESGGAVFKVGGNIAVHAGNSQDYKSRSLNAVRTTNSNFNALSTAVDTFTAGTNYIPSGGAYNQPADGDHHYLSWGGIEGSAQWAAQLDIDFYTDRVWFRRQSATSWQGWRQFIHDGNYGAYALPLSGGTVTGQIISSANGNQLRFVRADGTTPDWTFHGWGGGLNIYSSASSTLYIGRDGPGTSLDVYNGSLTQGGNQVLHAGNYKSYDGQLRALGDGGGMNFNTLTYNSMYYGYIENSANKPSGYSYSYGTILTFDPGQGAGGRAQIYISHAGNDLIFRGGWNGNDSWQPWNKVLTNQNYNGYSPTLTGGNASGTWGISISGNSATTTVMRSFYAGDVGNLASAATGIIYNYNTVGAWTGAPSGMSYGSVYHLGGSAGGGVLSLQLAADINHNSTSSTKQLWFRTSNNLGFQNDWKEVIHSGNYSSYVSSSAVQHVNGDSGTFNLNTSGQQSFVRFSTGVWGNPPIAGNYSHVLSVNAATDNRTFQIYMGDVPGTVYYRPCQAGTWHPWERILSSNNYNSYSPTLTGGNASGSWGINITGAARSIGVPSQQTEHTILDGPGNGPVIKVRYDGATANRYIDIGYKDGNGVYYEGFKIYNGGTPTTGGNTHLHAGNYGSYALPLSGGTISGSLTMSGAGSSNSIIFGDATKLINVEGYWMMFKGHQNEGFRWQTSDGATYTTRMQLTSSALTMNGNTVLHAGNYSSYALPLSGGTISGNQTITGNLTVSSGNVTGNGIILADDGDIVDLNDAYCSMRFSYGVRVFSANRGGSAVHTLHSNGTFTASGNITAYSDERLKTDWASVAEDFVERLAKVKSGTYTRIDNNKRQAGSSAQDWQQLLPEVVTETDNEEKTLSMAYGNAALVSAVELAKRVVDQEKRIAHLESLILKLIGD